MDERRRALVVGINAYGGGIPPLRSAVRDAEAVAEQLELSHGYSVDLLRDAEATMGAIMASLAAVIDEGLSEEDSFVVYYAGHGVADDDPGGADRSQGFLLAHDAQLTNKQGWLPMESFNAALTPLTCRHLMLVLDCCNAGAFRFTTSTRSVGVVKRPLYVSQYERYRKGIAWQVLTSASYDEEADDTAPTPDRGDGAVREGHSPFAQALIEGLSGNAADSSRGGMAADGVITATELHQLIYDKVAVNDRQTPGIFNLRLDNKGEFVFLAPGVELNLEPDPPLDDANNPWLGLDVYMAADRDLFFGRDEATKELVGRVEAGRFIAVVGASGSGKSSLIHAGVLPALEAPAWAVVELAPLTTDPIAQLSQAETQLAAEPASEQQLLVVDQFERLFTLSDDTTRARFVSGVRALVESDDGPAVLIAVRSDFEPRAAAELGDLWSDDARFSIPVFGKPHLDSVVIEAARTKAVFFEPAENVDKLVQSVTGMPGAAPLLSLTLAELYRQAQSRRRTTGTVDRMISDEDFQALGGVVGVVCRSANDLHDAADPAGRETIRRILLRLVDQKPDSQKRDGLVRRSVDRDELSFGAEEEQLVRSTLESLVAARLLIVGHNDGRYYVEPAHDALVCTWDRQLNWLAQSGAQDVVRDASKSARDWSVHDGKSKTSKHLWNQNPRLDELKAREGRNELNELEREFVAVSCRRRDRLEQIRRIAIIALAILTVVAVGAGIFALIKRSEAIEEAERAKSRALASDALNNVEIETDLAALLALESARVANTADARGSLAGVLSLPTRFLQRTHGHKGEITAIGFAESGRTAATAAATADASSVVTLWDVNEEPFPSPQATPLGTVELVSVVRDLFVTDDAEFPVLAFDTEGFAYVLNFDTGEFLVLEPPDEFVAATVNSDFTQLAGLTTDGVLRVYDIGDELNFTERPTPDVQAGEVRDLAFSPDGTTLAWAFSPDGTTFSPDGAPDWGDESLFALWSWAGGGEPFVDDAGAAIAAIAFSPDDDPGKAVVAVGLEEGTIFTIDRNDPSLIDTVEPSPVNQLFDLAFKPDIDDDGSDTTFTLASTHSNGDVNLFDVVPGDGFEPFGFAVETMLGHNDEAKKVAFSPDGRIASGDFSGEVIWWLDVPISSLGVPFLPPAGPSAPMGDAAFVNETQTISFDADGMVWLWDLDSGEGRPIVDVSNVTSVDAASGVIAVGLEDGSAATLEPDGTNVRLFTPDNREPLHVALSSDGRRLATVSPLDAAGSSGHLAIWDVATGTLANEQDLPAGFEPFSALIADDGAVWIGGRDFGREFDLGGLPTVLKVDATTGAVLGELRHSARLGNGVTALAISDNGRTLATGAMDRRISLWETDTLAAKPGGEFTGHRGNVTGIVFSDGGETLISSDDAGDVLMWNVKARRQFGRLGGPTDDVMSLEIDPGNDTLLASSEDGFVWTWSLELDEWRDRACQLSGRNMTQAEWELYGDGKTRVRHCVDFPAEDGDVRDAEYGESLTD